MVAYSLSVWNLLSSHDEVDICEASESGEVCVGLCISISLGCTKIDISSTEDNSPAILRHRLESTQQLHQLVQILKLWI